MPHGEEPSYLLESWLDFHDLLEEHPELERLLYDPVTGLPTAPLLFPRIASIVKERSEVSLLCVNVTRHSHIEEIYGWETFDQVMREVATGLQAVTGYAIRGDDTIAELMISGNSFVIVLSPPRESDKISHEALVALVNRVEEAIRVELAETIPQELFRKFGCYVGWALVEYRENLRLERLVYEGLEAALASSCAREREAAGERSRRLRRVLSAEDIRTVVLPVFDLTTGEVIGYEALSRGPEGTEFEHPDKLFSAAYDADLVLRLERICRRRAFAAAERLPEGRKLFVNIEPDAVGDPQLRDIMSMQLVEGKVLSPTEIVLELTERCAVNDFSAFRSTLEYLRALGFAIAVDDAGAGYGSLQALAEVRPEWLKVDLSLIRGVDSDEVRARLIESLVTFSTNVGSHLIAEGIETEAELHTLRSLGVRYGQGFLFGRPCDPFPADEDLPGYALLARAAS
jgi:EAL domain-containing protein (putative c-di-GMP-specific phosphodiesterase class I)/GGDEF domain-containing protein